MAQSNPIHLKIFKTSFFVTSNRNHYNSQKEVQGRSNKEKDKEASRSIIRGNGEANIDDRQMHEHIYRQAPKLAQYAA